MRIYPTSCVAPDTINNNENKFTIGLSNTIEEHWILRI